MVGYFAGSTPTYKRKSLKQLGAYTSTPVSKTKYGKASQSEVTRAMRDMKGLIEKKVLTKKDAAALIKKKSSGKGYAKRGALAQSIERLKREGDGRSQKTKKDLKSDVKSQLNKELSGSSKRKGKKAGSGINLPSVFSSSRKNTKSGGKNVRRRKNTRKMRLNKLRLRLKKNALKVNRRKKRKNPPKRRRNALKLKKNALKLKKNAIKRKANGTKRRKNTTKRRRNGTKKGMVRKTARRAYMKKRNPISSRRRTVRRRNTSASLLKAGGSKSTFVGKGLSLLGDLQKQVKKIPVLKYAAWVIVPAALGGAVALVHRTVEPRLIPALAESKIPGAKTLAKAPYLTTGALVGAALLGFSATKYGKKVISTQTAAKVAGLAVATGVFADMFLPSVVKAAAEVAKEEAVALAASQLQAEQSAAAAVASNGDAVRKGFQGYGDGGFYMIGANTRDLGRKAYADAHYADAAMASSHMHPDEVSAALQGASVYVQVFPGSPIKKMASRELHSRHAGLKGHRYGWLIKLVGFEKFQQIAALPPAQRAKVISRLKAQALASVPQALAQAKKMDEMHSSTSMEIAGASNNGAHGFKSVGYGALMFAGQNH